MFPRAIKIGKHTAEYDLFYKTMSDALGHSVTTVIDSSSRSSHTELSYLLAIAAATGDTRPMSDITEYCNIHARHLFYSFLVVHIRPLITDFNNYTNLDLTQIETKKHMFLYLVSGRLIDFKMALLQKHEVEEDFAEVLEQIRNILKDEGFRNLVEECKVKGVNRLL
jgi:hypothetical protein